ncbi:hypothetical protein Tco_1306647 [Tanacetum coccineum]
MEFFKLWRPCSPLGTVVEWLMSKCLNEASIYSIKYLILSFVHTPDDYVPTDDENVDDEEYERINKEMYDDVNVELKDAEHANKEKGDEEMTQAENVNAEHEEVSQEVTGDQVKDDAQATIPSGETKIISMMDIKVQHEDLKATISTTSALDSSTLTAFHQRLSNLENEVNTLRNVDHNSAIRAVINSEVPTVVKEYLGTNLDDTLHKSILADEDAIDKGVADIQKKRKPDDADRDKDPPAGPDQGLKRRKTGKDTKQSKKAKEDMGNTDEPPVVNVDPKDWFKKPERPPTSDPKWNECKTVDNKPPQKWLSDLAKAKKPSKTFDDLMSTPIDFSAFVMNRLQISDLTQDILVGPAFNLLKGTCRSYVELEYNMEECYKALTDQLDWNNPEGDRYPFNLSKPLPLIQSRNCQIVPVDYFFNNDLAYLQGGSTDRTYTTSLTKTKAAKYDLPGIEDMVPNLWSPIKVAYDKHALLVTNVKVNIWYGYGHLEEIEVQRSDQQLYKFMEGEDIVHLAAALRMFTRHIVIQKRVEDLQLGVKSYQKKLNISKPRTREEDLSRRAPYTTLSDPQGVIYEDKMNRKRLMRSDELYKFSDGTLQSVRDTLHDMATNLRMGYNKAMPKRRGVT